MSNLARNGQVSIAFLAAVLFSAGTRVMAQATPPPMAMPLVAPLFLENQEFSSVLYLVSALSIPASAELTLFDLDGSVIGNKTISLLPNGEQKIDIRQLLEEFNSFVNVGSLRVVAETTGGAGILGQLSLTHHSTSTNFFDEEFSMPSMHGSSTLRAVSDGDGSTLMARHQSLAGYSEGDHQLHLGDSTRTTIAARPEPESDRDCAPLLSILEAALSGRTER
jgi:hypothetical protein